VGSYNVDIFHFGGRLLAPVCRDRVNRDIAFSNDERPAVRRVVANSESSALQAQSWIEPVRPAPQLGDYNHVIERLRRRLAFGSRRSPFAVDQGRARLDAQLPQNSAEQKRLVLTIAEPSRKHRGGLGRLMRIGSELDAGVAHFVLDKAQRGDKTVFGQLRA